jgi:trk system potassium uptake protein TrkA
VLTGVDEENVIISLYAKQCGVEKVITKIDRSSIINMVETLGLDTVVSPKDIIANQILSFVRAHQAEAGAGINTLYKLYDKVEALEFTVGEKFSKQGVPLRDLGIKKNILVAGIIRDNMFILPRGESCLMANDRVIIISESKQITNLSEILK